MTKNKCSDRLTGCRSDLLDAEAILHNLHKPENLAHLLEECSPEVTLGAMIDKAWNLVAEASGDCAAKTEASDEDLKSELQETVKDLRKPAPEPQKAETPSGGQELDTIDQIHEQTRSMLLMMVLYLEQARERGATKLTGFR